MKHFNAKEKETSFLTFAYQLIFLLIIGCAVVSIPFGVQKYYTATNSLQNQKTQCEKDMANKEKIIANLQARILEYKNNTIKQYAENLKLQDPMDGQYVHFDAHLVPTRRFSAAATAMAAYYPENAQQQRIQQ